jgi:uncharacterized protein (TIGR02271 family)
MERTYDGWIGHDVYDLNGEKLGEVKNVYYDDVTGRPEWLSVKTGLFGTRSSFVPIHGSSIHDDADLWLAYDKDVIKGAPNVDDEEYLSPEQEHELWTYYGYDYNAASPDFGYGVTYASPRADTDYPYAPKDRGDLAVARDEVIRSEEQLRVGTTTAETGRVRLRKYVVTSPQTVQVPVSHEEVRVEREPIVGEPVPGEITGLGEAEAEVVLHEERPVVTKETVPVERVALEKDVVTDTESVTEEVAKEEVEIEGETDVARQRPRP